MMIIRLTVRQNTRALYSDGKLPPLHLKNDASELCVFCAQTVREQGTKPAKRNKKAGWDSQCFLALDRCCCLVCMLDVGWYSKITLVRQPIQ